MSSARDGNGSTSGPFELTGYIHGPTDAKEVARLENMAKFVAKWSLPGFTARPGDRVLDLGCGVGAMIGQLASAFPGVQLIGLDLQRPSLVVAQANHSNARYVQGNASDLPFRDSSFEHVHGSWILEHLSYPIKVLDQVRRVMKPGGSCQFLEVDNSSFRTVPSSPALDTIFEALNKRQTSYGGDPYVGQRLGGLFEQAGFADISVEPVFLVGWSDDPQFFRDFNRVFVEIVEGVGGELEPGLRTVHREAVELLRSLPDLPGSAQRFTPMLARGRRQQD
jgi:ubiquinone/menaquinone biosynthesis C-methylase UbiE